MDAPVTDPVSLLERVRRTFFAPSRLAMAIRGDCPWIDVLLISTVVAVASIASVPEHVFQADMQDAVTRRGDPVEITSSPADIARWGRMMGMIATIGSHPVIAFIVAGIVFAVVTTLFRAQVSYREHLSLASHAMLIPAAGTVLRVLGRAAGIDFIESDPSWPLGLRTVASIDPYIVWMLVVIVIGAHALDPKLAKVRAGALLVGGYLALVIVSTALLHPPG